MTHLQKSIPTYKTYLLTKVKVDEGLTNTFCALYTQDIGLNSFYFTLITSIKDKHYSLFYSYGHAYLGTTLVVH